MAEKKKTAQFIPMTSTQAAIGGGVLIGFFALWFLWAAVGDEFIDWIGGKNNLSGWVQAIGSIVAIFSAIYVVNLQNKKNIEINYDLELSKKISEIDSLIGMFKVVYRISLTLNRNLQRKKKIANGTNEINVPLHAWDQMVDILMNSQGKFSHSTSTRLALHLLAEIQNTSSLMKSFNGGRHKIKAVNIAINLVSKKKRRIERLCRFSILYKKSLEKKMINNK